MGELIVNLTIDEINKLLPPPQSNYTPLTYAVQVKDVICVEALLKQSAIDANLADKHGLTPLHHVAKKNQLEICEMLLHHSGIDVNRVDKDGLTPLMLAARNGHAKFAQMLINHPNIDVNIAYKDTGETALIRAICCPRPRGSLSIVKMLVRHPSTRVNLCNKYFIPPLRFAIYTNHTNIIRVLLSHRDIALNQRDKHGKTSMACIKQSQFAADKVKPFLRHDLIDMHLTREILSFENYYVHIP